MHADWPAGRQRGSSNLFLVTLLKIEILTAYLYVVAIFTAEKIAMATLAVIPYSDSSEHTCAEYKDDPGHACSSIITENDQETYSLDLQKALTQKQEIVLDFTSLKSCLDPQKQSADGDEVVSVTSLSLLRMRNNVSPTSLRGCDNISFRP